MPGSMTLWIYHLHLHIFPFEAPSGNMKALVQVPKKEHTVIPSAEHTTPGGSFSACINDPFQIFFT